MARFLNTAKEKSQSLTIDIIKPLTIYNVLVKNMFVSYADKISKACGSVDAVFVVVIIIKSIKDISHSTT